MNEFLIQLLFELIKKKLNNSYFQQIYVEFSFNDYFQAIINQCSYIKYLIAFFKKFKDHRVTISTKLMTENFKKRNVSN